MNASRKLLFILLLILSSLQVGHAKESKRKKRERKRPTVTDITLGLGANLSPSGIYQTNLEGSTNDSETQAFLLTAIKFRIRRKMTLSPEFGISLPEEGKDKLISKLTYYTLLPMEYRYKKFSFRLGTGLFFIKINSDGGTQKLDNGVSTQDFPMPSISSTSSNLLTTAGVGFQIIKKLSIRVETFVFNIHESETRTFHYGLSLHYHFGAIKRSFLR